MYTTIKQNPLGHFEKHKKSKTKKHTITREHTQIITNLQPSNLTPPTSNLQPPRLAFFCAFCAFCHHWEKNNWCDIDFAAYSAPVHALHCMYNV
jgi:hypothetical protein